MVRTSGLFKMGRQTQGRKGHSPKGAPATALFEPPFTPLDFAIMSFRVKKRQKEEPTTKNHFMVRHLSNRTKK